MSRERKNESSFADSISVKESSNPGAFAHSEAAEEEVRRRMMAMEVFVFSILFSCLLPLLINRSTLFRPN
jgi:hypothetical protein